MNEVQTKKEKKKQKERKKNKNFLSLKMLVCPLSTKAANLLCLAAKKHTTGTKVQSKKALLMILNEQKNWLKT